MTVPVITLDGPGGAGKGTIARLLAQRLSWGLLDSGALYRLTALSALRQGVDFDDDEALSRAARQLDVCFDSEAPQDANVFLQGECVNAAIRSEDVGAAASAVAKKESVRDALMQRQRDFAAGKGLVADGRDMGTVVFPRAPLKIYLTAGLEERAQRRFQQLKEQGQDASLAALVRDIQARDEQDMDRKVAPLKPADDAVELDSTHLSIDEVLQTVVGLAQERRLI